MLVLLFARPVTCLTGESRLTGISKRLMVAFGVALALIPLLLFTYFGLSTRLHADDYVNLALPLRIGAWEAMLHWRGLWNGGYSNFLLYGLLAPLGVAAPPFFSFTLIATSFVAFSWVVNTVLAHLSIKKDRRALVVALASLMMAATINGIYTPHTFHWFTSAVVYMWPAGMFLLGIALAVEAARRLRGNIQLLLAAIASAVYAFVNAGFSEMYLVFQLSAVALIAVFVMSFPAGPKRRSYLVLTMAALLASFASLALQVSAPGFATRSSASVHTSIFVLPLRDIFILIGRALDETLLYAGQQKSFAGFMLVAFAALFLTLTAGNRLPVESESRRLRAVKAPHAFALIVQLLFVPILWSQQSNDPQVFGQFSYAYLTAVSLNLFAIVVLLALVWRNLMLADMLNRGDGLMKYCTVVLLVVCLFFAMTQFRNIDFRASSYLFFSALTLLIMLGSQLAVIADETRLRRLALLSAFITASAIVTLAVLVSVETFMVRNIVRRSLAPIPYALMLAGLINGVTLGALIRFGFRLTGARAVWLRWLGLCCLIAALTIGAGIVIGQSRRIGYFQEYVEIWESQHQEIIRLRDEGDPAVFTMNLKRIVGGKMDQRPPTYLVAPIEPREKFFYGLEGTRYFE